MSSRRLLRLAAAGTVTVALCSLAAMSAQAVEPVAKKPKGETVTIYLTRHGETWLNSLGRVQGWTDSPLTEEGRADAEHLGAGLAEAGIEFEAAYSADMVRHWETVSLALDELDFDGEAVRDERLRELAFGRFEGMGQIEAFDEVAVALGYANAYAMLSDPDFDMMVALDTIAALNEGSGLTAETSAEVAERTIAALTDIAKKESKKGGEVLVVSSGITIMAALGALGADLSGLAGGIDNAAVSELEYRNGTWTVKTVNDLSYVEAGSD